MWAECGRQREKRVQGCRQAPWGKGGAGACLKEEAVLRRGAGAEAEVPVCGLDHGDPNSEGNSESVSGGFWVPGVGTAGGV